MAEDVIDHYIDRNGVKQDTAVIVAELNEVYTLLKKVRDTKIGVGDAAGFRATAKAAQDAKKNIEDLAKAQDRLAKAEIDAEKIRLAKLKTQQAQIKADNEVVKQIQLEEKADQESIKTKKLKSDQIAREVKEQEKLNAVKTQIVPGDLGNTQAEIDALNKKGAVINDLDKIQADAANSAVAYGGNQRKASEGTKQSIKEDENLIKARKNLKIANSEANVELQGYRIQTIEANKAAKQQAIAALGLLTPYQQLSKQYNEAALRAKDLAVEFGANSIQAKTAAKEALALNTQLQTIDKTVGQSQRNVGNYSGALSKAFSGLKTIANLLPGIGLAGLLAFAVDPIVNFISSLKGAESAQDKLNKAFIEAGKSAGDEIAKVTVLKDKLNDLSIPATQRVKLAKEYNEIAGEGNKIDIAQINNLTKVNSQIQKQIELIKQRALAKGAENALAKEAQNVFEKQQELNATQQKFSDVSDNALQKQLDNANKILQQAGKSRSGLFKLSAEEALSIIELPEDEFNKVIQNNRQRFEILGNAELQAQLRIIAKNKKLIDDARTGQRGGTGAGFIEAAKKDLKEAEKSFDELANLANKFISTESLIGKPEKEKAAAKESTKALLDSDFELYKIAQLRKKALLEEEIKNEFRNIDEKLKLQKQYYDASIELINRQEKEDLRIQNEKLIAQESNLKKAKGSERNNLITEIKNTNNQIKIIEGKAKDDRFAEDLKYSKDIEDLLDQDFKKRSKKMDEEFEQFKKFQEQKKQIVKDKIDLSANEQEISVAGQFEEKIAKATGKKREKLEREFQKNIADIRDKARLEQLINEERTLESQRQIFVAFRLDTTNIDKLITDNQISQSNIRIANTKREYTEKERIRDEALDNVLKYEQEAVDIISTIVNAQNTKEKNAIQDQIDLNEKKKNDKIDAINKEFISEEEKAAKIKVVEATAQADRERLEFRQRKLDQERARFEKNLGIMQIILQIGIALAKQQYQAAALAGAALIKAIATPIPKFKHGKNNDYEGLGIVDDGGVNEPILREDGSLEISKGAPKDRITYLKRKDVVFPSIDAMLNRIVMPKLLPIRDNAGPINDMQGVIDAINSISVTTQLITKEGWTKQNMRMNEYKNWVDKNIRN